MTARRLVELSARTARKLLDFGAAEVDRALGQPPRRPVTARQALEQWLSCLSEAPPVRGHILILALRNYMWIEWAVYCACVFRGLGYEATIAYWGEEVRRLYPERVSHNNFWSAVARIPGIELVDLSAEQPSVVKDDWIVDSARDWAPVAVAYERHVEEEDVKQGLVQYGPATEDMFRRICDRADALQAFLRSRRFPRAICPSGLIAESKTLLEVLRRAGLGTVCVEGWGWRPGHMIYNINSPALEYNVSGWLNALGPWDSAKEKEVDGYLRFLDGEKHGNHNWLENFYLIQRSKVSGELASDLRRFLGGGRPVFLLAPNVIGDSSTLRRETIFPSMQSWIKEVIAYFRMRPELKLVIRAHPAERWVGPKCAIFLGQKSRLWAQDVPNIFVIDSSDKLNTFSLLPFMRAGLVWLSSAGVDFVVRGVPTACAALPKYHGMNIVDEPATRHAYFAKIDRWALEAERPSADQILRGKRYLHVVFKGFSFEAWARNYRATGCRLGQMANQEEHNRFYRILAGDEVAPDRSPTLLGRGAMPDQVSPADGQPVAS